MATIFGWLTLLMPLLLQIIGFVLKGAADKQATLEAFQKLVEASANDGLISVQTKDKFASQKEALEARIKAPQPK